MSGAAVSAARAPQAARDASLDRLRGLAVVLMLLANLAPYLAPAPYPVWYRALSTFCAPAFVVVAGIVIGRQAPSVRHAAARGFFLVATGALLDAFAWHVTPFRSFDVLYLIGASLPVLAWARRAPVGLLLLTAAGTFALAAQAHALWGYRNGPALGPEPLRAALVGGWFPLLPWIGVGLIGLALGKAQVSGESGPPVRLAALLGLVLVVAGAVAWHLSDVPLGTRGGYAEYFYPPTFGVLALFTGLALLVLPILAAPGRDAFAVLERFGRRSLAVYVAHVLLIGWWVTRLDGGPGWGALLGAFVLLLAACALLVLGLERLGKRPGSRLLRQIVGG